MKTRTLNMVGKALYGALWQTRLSNAIGVNDRTMRRWSYGDVPIPATLRNELLMVAERRRREIDDAIRLLRTEE